MPAIGTQQSGLGRTANAAGRVTIELLHPYGFTSNVQPPSAAGKAEGVALYLTGDRSHGVIVAHGDRRFRLKPLANGEVAMHDDQGQKAHLMRGGIAVVSIGTIDVTAPGAITINAGGPVTINAPTINLKGVCNLGTGSLVPAAKQGTTDTAGNADVGNLASSVNIS